MTHSVLSSGSPDISAVFLLIWFQGAALVLAFGISQVEPRDREDRIFSNHWVGRTFEVVLTVAFAMSWPISIPFLIYMMQRYL